VRADGPARRGTDRHLRSPRRRRGGRGKKQPTSSARLYNLAADIHEDKDLSAEMPAKVKELQARWDEWDKANVKPLWGAGASDNDGPEPGEPKKGKKKAAK
jgi:hypothetical protein